MASLQYVIDSICSKLTVESMHRMIMVRLAQGPFRTDDIIPEIRQKDRSLDDDSARALAEAALEELAGRGELVKEGDSVRPPG